MSEFRRCQACGRGFVRVGRQLFCSPQCGNASRQRRLRARRKAQDPAFVALGFDLMEMWPEAPTLIEHLEAISPPPTTGF
jgi:predicted RNA-binding Zn-ribbon protein involved in translation (DUF1610 family)